MEILDESNLLTETEKKEYFLLLKRFGHEAHEFRLKVTEDQKPMDMNDLNYVIVVKVKATNLKSNISKVYENSAGSGVWLSEIEDDLSTGEFTTH